LDASPRAFSLNGKKYEGAIRGAISEWAMCSGLLEDPLTSLTSRFSFETVALKIRELPIYQERNERGHNMYNSALAKFAEYLSDGYESDIETDIDSILTAIDLGETEKRNLVKPRIGQGTFRQKLVANWNGCAVTGFKDTNLLVASHIKPWRASNNTERLDPFNGLLLVPN
jgi:putative restriction endonuclease